MQIGLRPFSHCLSLQFENKSFQLLQMYLLTAQWPYDSQQSGRQTFIPSLSFLANYVNKASGSRLEEEKMRSGLTCSARGFQRMFFSSAGAELSVLCGRFLRVSDTTPLSARSRPTRLRSCQPTCGGQTGRRTEAQEGQSASLLTLQEETHDTLTTV